MDRHPPPALRLPLFATLGETGRRLPAAWRGAWGSLGLCAAVSVFGTWAWPPGIEIGAGVLAAVAGLAAFGALLRIAVTQDRAQAESLGLGPAGLQIGRPEGRLLGAGLLCLLFLTMIVALLGLTVLAVSGAAELNVEAIQARDWARAGAGWRLVTVALLAVAALVIPLMLATRLAMFAPATVAAGRMISLGAMVISRGSVWPLFVGLMVTAAPTVAAVVLAGVAGPTGRVAQALVPFALTLVQLPLTAVFLGSAYKALAGRPDVTGTAEFGR